MSLQNCTLCRTQTSKRCESCKIAYFCSTAHQKYVWKTHKLICDKNEPYPNIFTQPPLMEMERKYILSELKYTPQRGQAASNENFPELRASIMDVCNDCDGCRDCRALRQRLDRLILALMYRYEEATRTSSPTHKELVLLRGILQKRGNLDVRAPPPWQPDETFMVFWALAAYEFPLAVESTLLEYRSGINRIMRHFTVLCTAYGKFDSDYVEIATDRLGVICKEDSKGEYGEAVKKVTESWCRGNGWELEDFLEESE